MSLRILTHVAVRSPAGLTCRRCGVPIPDPPTLKGVVRSVFDNEQIAVIETECIPRSSYRTGENDSNEMCHA